MTARRSPLRAWDWLPSAWCAWRPWWAALPAPGGGHDRSDDTGGRGGLLPHSGDRCAAQGRHVRPCTAEPPYDDANLDNAISDFVGTAPGASTLTLLCPSAR